MPTIDDVLTHAEQDIARARQALGDRDWTRYNRALDWLESATEWLAELPQLGEPGLTRPQQTRREQVKHQIKAVNIAIRAGRAARDRLAER